MDGEASPSTRYTPLVVWLAAAGLVLVHIVLAVAGTWDKGATFDETAYVGNGFSFWATNDYRMSPDAILPQRWQTLPIYLAGYNAPPTDDDHWFKGDVWTYGMRLLFRLGNDGDAILRLGRFMTTLLSAVLAIITFFWARKLFGDAGGLVALGLYAFNPNILAHGSSVTSDLAAALAFAAALFALWRVIHVLTPVSLLVSCLAVGCAFVTKYSAVMLIPMGLGMALLRLLSQRPWEIRGFGFATKITAWWQQAIALAGLVVLHVFAAWVIIWAMFGFRYEMFRDGQPGRDNAINGDWPQVLQMMTQPLPGRTEKRNAFVEAVVETCRNYRLLPEGYLYTFAGSVSTTAVRSAFLNGRYGIYGFASFFPYCFLYKTPISVFLVMLLALAAYGAKQSSLLRLQVKDALPRLWNGFYAISPLLLMLSIYWFMSIVRGINIGVRHIVPTFPPMFILAGAAGWWLERIVAPAKSSVNGGPADAESQPAMDAPAAASPGNATTLVPPQIRSVMKWSLVACFVWLVADMLFIFPNYLAYFNRIAGGSENGYKHLVDSSLDWGQELPNLRRWLDANIRALAHPPKVYISYFGTAQPSYYGVDGQWLPCFFPIEQLEQGRVVPTEAALEPGVYCISATQLQCVYNAQFPGPWRTDYEQNYQVLTRLMGVYLQNEKTPEVRDAELKKLGLPNWSSAFYLFEKIRFGRLCAYLRRRKPDDDVNHAILIFHLTKDELQQAVFNTPVELFPPPKSPSDNVPF
jgi:hypothetical protein